MTERILLWHNTPGHAWAGVDGSRFDFIARHHPELLRETKFFSGNNSFEEDVEVNRIVLAFPECFSAKQVVHAYSTIARHHPQIAEAYVRRVHEIALFENQLHT